MSNKCLNFGMIGGGGYALVLLNCLEPFIEAGQVRIHAAAVLPKEQGVEQIQLAKSRGARIYDNWEEMLEVTRGELDLCLIPTGIAQHRPMAVRALELGHRVFVEKPLAGSFEDALAMVVAGSEHGDRLSVGYHDIYQPSAHMIRSLIHDGTIGRVRSIRGYGMWPRNANYYGRNNWAGRVRVGEDWVLDSPLNNALAHYLNLMLYWASPDAQMSARFDSIEAELYRARPIENFDTGCVRIHCDAGFPVQLCVTHSCSEVVQPEVIIEGDKGRIHWKMLEQYTVHTEQGERSYPLEKSQGLRSNMFAQLIEWVHGRPAQRCTGLHALAHSLCVAMLHRFAPVHTVAAGLLDPAADPKAPVIKGIGDLFTRGFAEGRLPAELGAPWSAGITQMQTPAEWAEALEAVRSTALVG